MVAEPVLMPVSAPVTGSTWTTLVLLEVQVTSVEAPSGLAITKRPLKVSPTPMVPEVAFNLILVGWAAEASSASTASDSTASLSSSSMTSSVASSGVSRSGAADSSAVSSSPSVRPSASGTYASRADSSALAAIMPAGVDEKVITSASAAVNQRFI